MCDVDGSAKPEKSVLMRVLIRFMHIYTFSKKYAIDLDKKEFMDKEFTKNVIKTMDLIAFTMFIVNW